MHAMKPALRRVSYSLRLKRSFSSVIGTASSPSNAPPSSSSLKKEEQFDVVVTGGGPVVIAFILTLLKKSEGNLKVALINREHPKAVAGATTEHKICVISPHSKMFLEELGAWSYVEESAHSFDRMQISDSKSPGYLKFHASELNMQELGFICKESTIEESLHKVIEASQYKLSILQDYSMDKIIFPSDHIKDEASSSSSSNMLSIAMTSDGVPISNKTIHTKLLVGADGPTSFVRCSAGIPTWGWGYGQENVISTVQLDRSYSTIWQKYLKSGKITILPCHNSKASIIWTLPVLEANRIKQLSDEDYLEALNNVLFEDDEREGTSPLLHGVLEGKFMRLADSFSNASAQQAVKSFGSQLIGLAETIIATSQMTDPPLFPPNIMDVIGPRQSVPLSFQQANSYIAPRIALIGDAAHNNAQAGQSLNLGIFDAKELSTLIFDAIEGGSDIGNSLTLKAYDRSRSVKNVSAMGAADLINSTFHERDGLPRGISEMKQIMRSIGMLGLQNMKPIKAEIAKIAMGLK